MKFYLKLVFQPPFARVYVNLPAGNTGGFPSRRIEWPFWVHLLASGLIPARDGRFFDLMDVHIIAEKKMDVHSPQKWENGISITIFCIDNRFLNDVIGIDP